MKKPKIDADLRDKLANEIKNPTTFMGRQSAHADMAYTIHDVQVGVPKSSYLSAQRNSLPEIGNLNKLSAGRNSLNISNVEAPIKKDRDYIRKIIQESKRNATSVDDSGEPLE